jgi:hypothetical protein
MIIKHLVAWTAISLAAVPVVISHFQKHELCSGIVAENDRWIPVGAKFATAGGIDEVTFNRVLDKVEAIYAPIIKKAGGNLKVNRLWDDGTVNAYAEQNGKSWEINMFGGLARHPAINEDSMALVACHELGHHLGGAPKVENFFSKWATNEGGADYFAVLKCLRLVFADEAANQTWVSSNKEAIPQAVQDQCADHRGNDALICVRSAMASLHVAKLFEDLSQDPVPPDFTTPDPSVVDQMDDNHPATQCRLDTYFNGALCDKEVAGTLSNTNYKTGTCTQADGYTFGYRPLCWFKP